MDALTLVIALIAASAVFIAVSALLAGGGTTRREVRRRTVTSTFVPASPQLNLRRVVWVSDRARQIVQELERAGLALTASEYLLIRLGSSVGVGALAFLLNSILRMDGVLGIIVLVLGFLFGYNLPKFYVNRRTSQRLMRIEEQLLEALQSIAKSLRAGVGITQAIEYAGREVGDPLGSEFQRIVHELQLGADMELVLDEMNGRLNSKDLEIVSTAMIIQRRVGGNLSEILINVAETIRARRKIREELHAETAMQRWQANGSAMILILIAIFFFLMNPNMARLLFETTAGQIALGIGIFFEVLGIVLVRKFAEIEV